MATEKIFYAYFVQANKQANYIYAEMNFVSCCFGNSNTVVNTTIIYLILFISVNINC